MRISELFDELDEHELDELLDLPVRGTAAVSARRIRHRVNRALDADPAERRVHMKQAYKKGICAALIAACLLTGAFAAATKLNLLRGWLDEDSIGELVVNTDKQSVETQDFRLTIEESLSDESTTYVAYSLTALSDYGRAILEDLEREEADRTVWTGQDISTGSTSAESLITVQTKGSSKVTNVTQSPRSVLTEYLPASQSGQLRYRSITSGVGSLSLQLYGSDEVLQVPQTVNAQNAEIRFDPQPSISLPNGSTATFYSLRLTSLGYALDSWSMDMASTQRFDLDYLLRFLMDDGSIRTLGELTAHDAHGYSVWDTVLDLRTVKAVVLNDIAYFLDGSDPLPCPLADELGVIRLEPSPIFTVPANGDGTAVLPGYPARALLEPFGGTVEYDAATKTAVLTRGDYTCTVTVGSPVVQFGDGQSLTHPMPSVAEIVDGTLYLFPFGFDRALGIYDCGVDYKYKDAYFDPLGIEAVYYTV